MSVAVNPPQNEPNQESTSSWSVYIVECSDKTLYTGITTDLERRIIQHNDGRGARYTRTRLPVRLVWSEPQPDESAARKEEARIKKLSRTQKIALLRRSHL